MHVCDCELMENLWTEAKFVHKFIGLDKNIHSIKLTSARFRPFFTIGISQVTQ